MHHWNFVGIYCSIGLSSQNPIGRSASRFGGFVPQSCVHRISADSPRITTYVEFNLAPMSLRRDIGMLGVLLKICHGLAHPDFRVLRPNAPSRRSNIQSTRAVNRRHDLQLIDQCNGSQLAQFQRSLFGLVKVWNALPMAFVHTKSVSMFQAKLIQASKHACSADKDCWQDTYAIKLPLHILLVRYCFT